MKTLGLFVLSLFALPFLLPWYISEKFFQYCIQPSLVSKYQVGQIRNEKKRKFRLRARTVFLLLILTYIGFVLYHHIATQESLITALQNSKVILFMMYADLTITLNTLVEPVNTLIMYANGENIEFLTVALSFYLLLLPFIVVTNMVFSVLTTRMMLQRAVSLRDEADKDVHIVNYSERAKNDEIFFGLDLNNSSKPFYVKVQWLQGHTQVIGSPGSGKTESIIQPLWFQSVRRNVPTIVLDGKASSRNIDRFYTIATSLAQGHEILYFNPAEANRSATYNPLKNGSVDEVKNRLLNAVNWQRHTAGSREKLDFYLGLVLQAIRKNKRQTTLREILRYFDSKMHVQNQLGNVSDPIVRENLNDMLNNYSRFQKETAFFTLLLLQICNAEYAQLFNEEDPELDLQNVYTGKKDCYFTLPVGPNDPTMAFLGQLIVGDIIATFHHVSTQSEVNPEGQGAGNGLLIVDELAKFASPQFIDLLRTARNLGVSVCYTNQTMSELENPELHVGKAFIDELAEHTNVICCFNLSGPETVQAIADRMRGGDTGEIDAAEIIKHLDVGRCVVFVRQPRVFSILKTGYFKFDKLIDFQRDRREELVGS